MIRIDKNHIEFEGNKLELIAELSMLMHDFYEKRVIDDRDIEQVVKIAKTSKEQLRREAEEKLMGLLVSTLGEDAVRDFVNGGKKE